MNQNGIEHIHEIEHKDADEGRVEDAYVGADADADGNECNDECKYECKYEGKDEKVEHYMDEDMCNNHTVDMGLDSEQGVDIDVDRDTNLDVRMRGTDVDVCYWLWLDHELSFDYVVGC